MRFEASVPGGVIVGSRDGGGEPALVLHGGPGLNDYLDHDFMAELDRWSTIRYQQRGLEPSVLDGPHTVDVNVADAIAVLDALELDDAWIVGHSWGGHLAMHIAAAHPDRVRGLVVIDTVGAVPDGGLAALTPNINARLPPETVAEADRLEAAGDGAAALALIFPGYFARPEDASPAPNFRSARAVNESVFASIAEHFERGTLVNALPRLDLPALVIHGCEDPIPVVEAERTAALMPSAELELLDDAGHFPWLERPGAIRAAIERHLSPA